MPSASATGSMSSARSRFRTTNARSAVAHRREREAAIAHHGGRHAVPARTAPAGVPEHLRVHVGVAVDEAGRDHETVGVDLGRTAVADAADEGDPVPDDADVGAVRAEAGTVDDGAVADHEVVRHVATFSRGPCRRATNGVTLRSAMSPTSAAIRRSLSHPVIDIDGHIAEYFPALAPYLEQEGLALDHPALRAPAAAVPRSGPLRGTRWTPPSGCGHAPPAGRGGAHRPGTRSTSPPPCSPGLLYERLDELGLDFSVVYPSLGLVFLHTWEDDATARRVPGAQPLQRRDLRAVRRPARARRRHPDAHPGRGRRRAASTRSRCSGSSRCSAPVTCSGRSSRRRRPIPTWRGGRRGSTSSASTARTTTTRCGRPPRSSASRSPSTRASSGSARGARSRATCTTTSARSPRVSTRSRSRCSSAA